RTRRAAWRGRRGRPPRVGACRTPAASPPACGAAAAGTCRDRPRRGDERPRRSTTRRTWAAATRARPRRVSSPAAAPASRSAVPRSARARSSRASRRGLEQLDRIARRVLEQDLLAAVAEDDVTAEARAGRTEPLDLVRKVFDLELDAVPASGLRLASVGHGLCGAARAAGGAQEQPQRTA